MPVSGRPLRPSIEAQMQFTLLMELYDKGPNIATGARIEAINKFLEVSNPGITGQVRWGLLKGNRAESIVNLLRWGLNQIRSGEPFMRSGPPDILYDLSFDGDGIIWDRSRGRAVRVGSRDPAKLFITRVFELLTEVAPWLRVCQRAECRRFFLFQRPKQIYCGDTCAQQVRMARFLARKKTVSGTRGRREK